MQLGSRRLNRQTCQCHQDSHTSLCCQPKLLLPHLALPCAKRHRDARRSKLAQPTAALAPDPGAGDERVQETLVDIIGVQIGQQHVKEYFDDESDKLRKTAEEVRLKPSLACQGCDIRSKHTLRHGVHMLLCVEALCPWTLQQVLTWQTFWCRQRQRWTAWLSCRWTAPRSHSAPPWCAALQHAVVKVVLCSFSS